MTTFDALLAALPANKKFSRTLKDGEQERMVCIFGMNASGFCQHSAPITTMPVHVDEARFMDSANGEQLLAAFTRTIYARQVSSLYIGGSSELRSVNLDYRGVVKVLAGAQLPNLRTLILGEWDLFCNESCAFGQLGDLAPMLENLPSLEKLELYGDIELSRIVHLPRLQSLSIDVGANNAYESKQPLSQQSLEYLLQLSPALKTLELGLSYDFAAIPYHFPSGFLEGRYTPLLRKLELDADMSDAAHVSISTSTLLAKPGLEHRCWRTLRNPQNSQTTSVRIPPYPS